ncbi:palmitoyltransferase ZDHHC6-like [Limulus polyphemus]|uniref:Palmitoyltransferase n=1 Tax=Limulus polyphemus TaxID=6850 RepID=A0ABM1T1E9_LIMPO|nr:palmitoyltransferase ZDHHC6-like [Limulus polyphemus]
MALCEIIMSALKRIFHWGPLIALFIIKSITFSTLYMTSMFLPPLGSLWGCFNHIVFLSLVGCTLYNFFMAMFGGPGFVHFGWKPAKEENLKFLQYCTFCEGYKAPRAHHCRKCKRCVMKMDHHCPWINTCCGHKNHAHFTFFLFCAVCGCCHATVLLIIGLYRAFHLSWYFYYGDREHLVYLTLYPLVCTVFSLGLAIGVVIAVGGLFLIQMKIILKNETSIENWIVTKALSRARPEKQKFIYPYSLGWWQNLQEVFPLPKGDGLTWPVVKGCSQYTLTMEQLCLDLLN